MDEREKEALQILEVIEQRKREREQRQKSGRAICANCSACRCAECKERHPRSECFYCGGTETKTLSLYFSYTFETHNDKRTALPQIEVNGLKRRPRSRGEKSYWSPQTLFGR